jgi:hypothetical protein
MVGRGKCNNDRSYIGCAVERRWSTAGVYPPGNWFAPPGSNRSSSGGNEAAEAFGVEGRIGDSASLQAVTRVNAEQAPKRLMQEPTRPDFGEGRSGWNRTSEQIPSDLPGYWRRHVGEVDHTQHGKSQR